MNPWESAGRKSGELWNGLRDDMSSFGILGGTFDPIHYGHLVMAQNALEHFSLDQVVFIPVGQAPHKDAGEGVFSSPRERYEMTLLATGGNNCFQVWDYEIKKNTPSYTVETLASIKKMLIDKDIFFIMGQDALAGVYSWKSPEELLLNYDIIVCSRGGSPERITDEVKGETPGARLYPLEIPDINIASTEIRDRVVQGRSITYLTPPAVVTYILKNELYARGVDEES